MPLNWENKVITKAPHTKTEFSSVMIEDPSSCHKFFGKYDENGHTIVVCQPERGSCAPYIIV